MKFLMQFHHSFDMTMDGSVPLFSKCLWTVPYNGCYWFQQTPLAKYIERCFFEISMKRKAMMVILDFCTLYSVPIYKYDWHPPPRLIAIKGPTNVDTCVQCTLDTSKKRVYSANETENKRGSHLLYILLNISSFSMCTWIKSLWKNKLIIWA